MPMFMSMSLLHVHAHAFDFSLACQSSMPGDILTLVIGFLFFDAELP